MLNAFLNLLNMTLATQLQAFENNMKGQIPTEVFAAMKQATADLKVTDITAKVPQVGEAFTDFQLPDHTGADFTLSDLVAQGPLVISFYRGGWCLYCNITLQALQQKLPEFKALGAQLVAITPELPDHSLSTIEKNNLLFPVLTDKDNTLAKQLGLVFQLPENIQALYADFGLDVTSHNGNSDFELPLAATFVVGDDGLIKYVFADADYTKRAEPSDILAALK